MEIDKTIEHLEDLKERLKLQADIKGYGFYIDFINDAISLLKEQHERIEELEFEKGWIESPDMMGKW